MEKPVGNLVFTFVLIVVLAVGVFQSLYWPLETKLFPTAVGSIMLVLCMFLFGRDLRRLYASGMPVSDPTHDVVDPYPLKPALRILAWLFAFGFGIWVLGFYLAAFLFVSLFIKFQARMSMLASLAYGAVSAGGIYLVFVILLKQSAYPGLLFTFIDNL